MDNDVRLTISHLAPLLRRRKVSPVELARDALQRIERLEPKLNAYITVTRDWALESARRSEREIADGRYRGPLHGIPINLKDIFYTSGIRTTAGSKILRRFVPRENATSVDRLLEAGAVVLGKTNLHEFAYGITNNNPHYGAARNPWNRDHITGGSSGGSAAAVAAGCGIASLGSDTGGSVRIPAAACGIVGLKPTRGRVSLFGVVPLAWTLDHVGPICRSVEDAARVLEAISGADPRDPGSFGKPGESFSRELRSGLEGLRVGIPKSYFFERLDRSVRDAVVAAVRAMEREGADVREVAIPMIGETNRLADVLTISEAVTFHSEWLRARPGDYGEDVRARMTANMGQLATVYIAAQEERKRYTRAWADAMSDVDVLAAPTLTVPPPRLDQSEVRIGRATETVRMAMIRLTRASNLTGFPAVSVPCGFTRDRLPIGLQLIAKPLEEARLLRAAYGYEQATPWHKEFPQVG